MRALGRWWWIVLVIVAAGVAMILINHQRSMQQLTISWKNVSSVSIYTTDDQESGEKSTKPLYELARSGETVKLKKNTSYFLKTEPLSGYESQQINFILEDSKKNIDVNPYYSPEKLDTMLSTETTAISQALLEAFPNTSQYKVQPGQLFHWGDWYGTSLVYAGNNDLNKDSLRVVLHKEGGVWKVKTGPPSITLSKEIFPGVPVDILRDVNRMPTPEIPKPAYTGARYR